MKHAYGLDKRLEADQRSGARCVEGAHRFSSLDREVAMLITCGDLGVQQQRGVVFVLAVAADARTSVKRVALPRVSSNWLQRTKSYVLFLLEYHAEPQAPPLLLTRS